VGPEPRRVGADPPFIVRGATNYLHSHFDVGRALKEIQESRITDVSTVPTILISLMDFPAGPAIIYPP